jgi:beta-lactamase superfamily II metal-dependent hydrolase
MRWAIPFAFFSASCLYPAEILEFHFIDVEQGNSMLIVSPSGESLLIDAGSAGHGGRDAARVLAAIKKAGLSRIDYLVVTHYHNDHYGATPELARMIPIVNWIDHGPSVETGKDKAWQKHWEIGPNEELHKSYLEARAKSRHRVVKSGDTIPIRGIDVRVLTSAGEMISKPLPGAGQPNSACAITPLRTEDETEDGQSVGVLLTFGNFRFVFMGDLTWNKLHRLFCPNDRVGPVDVYVTTHHGMSIDKETAGAVRWGRSCCSEAELHALRPRVAILNYGERYHRLGNTRGWRVVKNSPRLEDFWQMHYQTGGGKEHNVPEQFIANLKAEGCQGNSIRLSANKDGSFAVTNTRNGHSKKYAASSSQPAPASAVVR